MPNPVFSIGPSNLMLDLETLGTGAKPVLTALGAVFFTRDGLGAEFYSRIDPESCAKIGMTVDLPTVLWWLKQPDEARLELVRPAPPIASVLDCFDAFVRSGPPDVAVWGNGAAADNVWLPGAYLALGRTAPWRFWNDRCYRTMKALRPDVEIERTGTHHNALADARSQALHLIRILNAAPAGVPAVAQ